MSFEWDETKRRANLRTHRVDFADVAEFEWETAIVDLDDRFDYAETRWIATGFFRAKLHIVVYTRRGGNVRVISFRPADPREKKYHAKTPPPS